jgi:hypothetical protein
MNWQTKNIGNSRLLALLILLLLSLPFDLRADILCPEGVAPVVTGEIKRGDFRDLLECLNLFAKKGKPQSELTDDGKCCLIPIGWIHFDSVGGDVNEAIKIGRFLRESLVEVLVRDKCFSACFLSIVGAVLVWVGEPFGQVGIHRVFYEHDTLRSIDIEVYESEYNRIKRIVGDYLFEMDVPASIVEKAFSIPSDDLYYLSNEELRFLRSKPAYDEWIRAQCHHTMSGSNEQGPKFRACEDAVRWNQFTRTLSKYRSE